MRRASAIALFAVLVMPAVLPLLILAQTKPEALLPACCRRDGKHHCAMMAMMAGTSQEPAFRQENKACPYRSGSITLAHTFAYYPPAAFRYFETVVQCSTTLEQAERNRLISENRSHQKRGPPSFLRPSA